jgi:hypothetical protein
MGTNTSIANVGLVFESVPQRAQTSPACGRGKWQKVVKQFFSSRRLEARVAGAKSAQALHHATISLGLRDTVRVATRKVNGETKVYLYRVRKPRSTTNK